MATRTRERAEGYLIHVAGFNLGVLMRALYGQGTPRETEALYALFFVLQSDAALAFALIAAVEGELAAIVIVAADPLGTEKPGLRHRADNRTGEDNADALMKRRYHGTEGYW